MVLFVHKALRFYSCFSVTCWCAVALTPADSHVLVAMPRGSTKSLYIAIAIELRLAHKKEGKDAPGVLCLFQTLQNVLRRAVPDASGILGYLQDPPPPPSRLVRDGSVCVYRVDIMSLVSRASTRAPSVFFAFRCLFVPLFPIFLFFFITSQTILFCLSVTLPAYFFFVFFLTSSTAETRPPLGSQLESLQSTASTTACWHALQHYRF